MDATERLPSHPGLTPPVPLSDALATAMASAAPLGMEDLRGKRHWHGTHLALQTEKLWQSPLCVNEPRCKHVARFVSTKHLFSGVRLTKGHQAAGK